MFSELDMQSRIAALLCLQVLIKHFHKDKVGKTGKYLDVCAP